MTARYWKKQWVKAGDNVTASTGYPLSTRFAVLKILAVHEWDADSDGVDANLKTGLPLSEIAKREGFETWQEFIDAYGRFNQERLKDRGKHYFIHFELERRI